MEIAGGNLEDVIAVICRVGGVMALNPDDDFYDAGVSSIAALSLLTELEDVYSVSIPDEQFIGARTARRLHAVIGDLKQEQV